MAMDTPPTSVSDSESKSSYLYFAYGSNMHLKQMAQRCPQSLLFAKGVLRNYKWQTNSRGGGNVLPGNAEDVVHGIVFRIPTSDIEALRQSEGVDKELFIEKELSIELEDISDSQFRYQNTVDVVEMLSQRNLRAAQKPLTAYSKEICDAGLDFSGPHKALVYVSNPLYNTPGTIRGEYIKRMQLAMADARSLGLSQQYLTDVLGPVIFRKDGDTSVQIT